MPISDLELAELKTRTANAIRTKSSLANVDGHIEALKSAIGKSRLPKAQTGSTPTAYLYQLILLAESLGSEPVQVKEPEPVQVKKPEPVQVKEPEPTPIVEVVETPVDAPSEASVEEPKAKEYLHSKGKKDKKDKKS